MAANTNPIFCYSTTYASIQAGPGFVCTDRVTMTNSTPIFTASGVGAELAGIKFTSNGTISSAGIIFIWELNYFAGQYILVGELAYPAYTASTTVPAWTGYWIPKIVPFIVPAPDSIIMTVTTSNDYWTATPIAFEF